MTECSITRCDLEFGVGVVAQHNYGSSTTRTECSITRCDLEFNVGVVGGTGPRPASFGLLSEANRIIIGTTLAMYQQAANLQVGAPC